MEDTNVVLVIGYYDRGNLGDDMFKYTLQKYVFNELELCVDIVFKNIDEVTHSEVHHPSVKAVFFGPGDVVNDYFISKLTALSIDQDVPVYALGVGFPFKSTITPENLNHFEYVIHRNITDQEDIHSIVHPTRARYAPDVTWFIRDDTVFNPFDSGDLPHPNSKHSKKVGVCLTRTIYDPDHPERYDQIITTLGMFFAKLIQTQTQFKTKWYRTFKDREAEAYQYTSGCYNCFAGSPKAEYEVYLIPFCCPNGEKPTQDDRIMCQDVRDAIRKYCDEDIFNVSVHLLEDSIRHNAVTSVFTALDVVVASRFHAHVFSAITNTPFVSLHSTRKVELLIKELSLSELGIHHKFEVDNITNYPVGLNLEDLETCFDNVIEKYEVIKHKLSVFNENKPHQLEKLKRVINNLVYYTPQTHFTQKEYLEKANEIAKYIITSFELDDSLAHSIVHVPGMIGHLISEQSQQNKDLLANIISYVIFTDRCTDYNYGITQQVFSEEYNLFESCKWIMDHANHKESIFDVGLLKNRIPHDHRIFDLSVLSRYNLTNYHRSGWGFVMKHLRYLQCNSSTDCGDNSSLLFDPYLDKTFGWDYDFLKKLGILPLRREWTGIFHHTPTPDYGLYTLDTTFEKEGFIESLKWCNSLFVFSENLRDWIERKMWELYDNGDIEYPVAVYVLKHPTESVDECLEFRPRKLFHNPVRKIVQIGGWLRDTYAIYRVRVPSTYTKVALKGKGMGHYYIDDERFDEIVHAALEIGNDEDCAVSCQAHPTGHGGCGTGCNSDGAYVEGPHSHPPHQEIEYWKVNKYVKGLVDTIEEMHNSVVLCERIGNEDYDDVLSRNVVFVKMIDGSAINTVIECIVRNTPILVNRIPAVVEYLGEGYPLYYDTLDDVYDLLSHPINIIRAYSYLKHLNKTPFDIHVFTNNLISYFI